MTHPTPGPHSGPYGLGKTGGSMTHPTLFPWHRRDADAPHGHEWRREGGWPRCTVICAGDDGRLNAPHHPIEGGSDDPPYTWSAQWTIRTRKNRWVNDPPYTLPVAPA